MLDPVSDKLKSDIRSSLQFGENPCPWKPMSVNGVSVQVRIDSALISVWGVKFLSGIGNTIDNEWAILCEAYGHVEVPALAAEDDVDDEEDAPSVKNTFYGFRVGSEGISGTIRFYALLDMVDDDSGIKFVYRDHTPFSLVINEGCLDRDFPEDDLKVSFPTGQMIFE